MSDKKIALVTGGNRGIGFAICRLFAQSGMHVILTARSEDRGKEAQAQLANEGVDVDFYPLAVTEEDSIQALAVHVAEKHGKLDVLVNNAGINIKEDQDSLTTTVDQMRDTLETNSVAPWRLTQALADLLRESDGARVVNVSSGLGQLAHMNGNDYPAYRVSKTALNAITRVMAAAFENDHVKVNSMCPGWVKTDMGGDAAPRSPEKAAEGALELATLPDDGPTGQFMRDGRKISW